MKRRPHLVPKVQKCQLISDFIAFLVGQLKRRRRPWKSPCRIALRNNGSSSDLPPPFDAWLETLLGESMGNGCEETPISLHTTSFVRTNVLRS